MPGSRETSLIMLWDEQSCPLHACWRAGRQACGRGGLPATCAPQQLREGQQVGWVGACSMTQTTREVHEEGPTAAVAGQGRAAPLPPVMRPVMRPWRSSPQGGPPPPPFFPCRSHFPEPLPLRNRLSSSRNLLRPQIGNPWLSKGGASNVLPSPSHASPATPFNAF